jgi:hypothetical protein
MTNTCKVCKGIGCVDDYDSKSAKCTVCAWPLRRESKPAKTPALLLVVSSQVKPVEGGMRCVN